MADNQIRQLAERGNRLCASKDGKMAARIRKLSNIVLSGQYDKMDSKLQSAIYGQLYRDLYHLFPTADKAERDRQYRQKRNRELGDLLDGIL